ncbi:hypothetical protein ACFFX1_08675 [Dactylosporangium sucinum]|uniref:hypothetical protein n=1 Tax=Dactylosporangium sucinum TaxID=1424081 RepID=UPI00167E87D1|nr:hypothetical protein [Dactylosporangium sucinum]
MSSDSGQPSPDPVAAFADRLRHWQVQCGNPSVRDLERLTRQAERPYARGTIQDKLSGRTAATQWEFVEAFVRACALHAGRPADVDLAPWRTWHRQLLEQLAARRAGQRTALNAARSLQNPAPRPRWSPRQRQAFANVWRAFLLVDRFNRHGIADAIHSGTVDPSRWTVIFDAQAVVSTERLDLPADMYDLADRALRELETNVNALLDDLRRLVALREQGGDPNTPERLDGVRGRLAGVISAFDARLTEMHQAYSEAGHAGLDE